MTCNLVTTVDVDGLAHIPFIFQICIRSMPATACHPQRASRRAPCQPAVVALPERSKRTPENCLSQRQGGLTSEDLQLIAVCLLGQSQEDMTGQRMPAIRGWHLFKGGKGTRRKNGALPSQQPRTHWRTQTSIR